MQFIIGAYSQLPDGSLKEEFETLVSKQLKPLLTMVYANKNMKLLFRLSIAEFEYIESAYPEVNMLINELCRRGQIEILSSSYYDVILSLIPTHERSAQVEKATTFIRKNFSKKPRGLWLYNQVFNPTILPVVSLCGLNYIVISTYNQISNNVAATRPFYTEEMGKASLIFPTDDRFSKLTADLYKGIITLEKYLEDTSNLASSSTNVLSTIMLNLDQLMAIDGSSQVFSNLFHICAENCTLPSIFLQENQVVRTQYLPSGIYGRDYNIGKATSINQLIYESPMLSRHYGLVNAFREIIREGRKYTDDRKYLESLLMMASTSTLFFPNESHRPDILRLCNQYACEIESRLAETDGFPLPGQTDIDFDRLPEYLVTGKSFISYLSVRGAVLNRLTVTSSLYDLAFHSGDGLFADSFIPSTINRASKEIKLVSKPYDVTPLDKKNTDFFAKAPVISLGKGTVSLTKRYKFRQSNIMLEIEIENLSEYKISGYNYINTINLAMPCTYDCKGPEVDVPADQITTVQSVTLAASNSPLSIVLTFSEAVTITRTDFEQKAHTWLGDKSFYEYTQLKIQKPLSLGPYDSIRISIGIKTEKRKEKHNDTAEQSAP